MRRALQIVAVLAAMAMSCAPFAQTVGGSEIGKFPTAAPLNGNERILADQNGNTVNITPSQFGSFLGTPTNQQPLPVSIGGTGANTATAALINLLPSLVANDCLAVNSGGTGVVWTPCGTGSTVFQANGIGLSSSSTVNFLNSAATTGLTLGFTNPSAGGVQLTLSGALTAAGGGTGLTGTPANGQLPIGTGTGYQLGYLTAGSNISISNPSSGNITISATIPTVPVFQVNTTALLGSTAVNFLNGSATNGLTVGFTNSTAGTVQAGVTGTLTIAGGGTGLSATPANGQVAIGTGSGYTLSTLTAGPNVTITNTSGGIQIAAAGNPVITAVDSGAANAYVLTTPAPIGTLASGQLIQFVPTHGNTGTSTATLNGGSAIGIVGLTGSVLAGGELSVPTWIQYTGALWQIVGTGPAPSAARTPAEITAGKMPVNFGYVPGDPRRWGAVGGPSGSLPSTDDSTPWANDVATGYVNLPAGWAFKVVTAATHTGQLIIVGQGQTSQIYSDGNVVNCTSCTGSIADNFWLGNITAPWIITRNPANWTANISGTLQQSNTVLGYQPTVNDTDIWSSLTTPQQNQNIGPVLYYSGAASNILVSRITGRFVRVEIRDAINSTIRDCDVRGGKGVWGTLEFDNWQDSIQRGSGNRAINNRVQYGSFSGVYFASNDNFQMQANHTFRNGESGVKTLQANGVAFSASVGGATSGTIAVSGIVTGTWTFVFSDGETRTVTVSGTSATWSGALNSVAITSASGYNTTLNPQNFRGQIANNYSYQNYYDGLDLLSSYDTTVDAALTYTQVTGNYSYNNGGTGINTDGRYETIVGNHAYDNNSFGFWNNSSFSLIEGNHAIANNLQNGSSIADLLGGGQGNSIIGNKVIFTATAGYPIYAPQTAGLVPHVATDNVTIGGTNFWGNQGSILPVLSNNIDATTGARTRQSGLLSFRDSGGTLQHAFFNDISEATGANASRIAGNTSGGFTNTPTGTDASTAFAAGAKVSTTDTNGIVLNTNPQWNGDVDFEARIAVNTTGTALTVSVSFESFSVNGVTQLRPVLRFWNAATGAAFVINTANVPASTALEVEFTGYLSSNIPAANDDYFHQRMDGRLKEAA